MSLPWFKIVGLWLMAAAFAARAEAPFDAAAAFGARPSIAALSLSPDGMHVAYVVPATGQGSALFTLDLAKGAVAHGAMGASGKPDRLGGCEWVSNSRLVCLVYGVTNSGIGLVRFSRIVAVDADGSNIKMLSTRSTSDTHGYILGGGNVIDWLPDEDGAVLMTRVYLPNEKIGSRFGSSSRGLGVDRVDTRTLQVKPIEPPREDAVYYLSDGYGTVRIMGSKSKPEAGGMDSGNISFVYRVQGSREWQKLSDYNSVDRSGFEPYAVDHDRNIAYGFRKKDGRRALYSVALDGTLHEELIFSRPDVDVDHLVRIGRRERVVGVSFATDARQGVFFDPEIQRLTAMLTKALQGSTPYVTDSSVDENKLLVFAGSDQDPGVYYLFDRKEKQLQTFLVVRSALEGQQLANMKAVSYPARDGVMVPGYLTLPPGREDAKGLPAIVLPHGGPSARDEWGFDWLSQFYAARGYAVLQPNFRGSTGYGDAWFSKNGFRSWPTAIGDVLDAGRWLIAQGIADPAKIGIVGWSYGGYAALQSAVMDPTLFKAVVAIAPVTDLSALKEQHRRWSDFNLVSEQVGDGPHVREGSPAMNADKIKVPVLLFHGALDTNVDISQSKEMVSRLTAAGAKCELVTWDDLDHYLEDSSARTELLRKSDAFLRTAMGL